MTTGVAAAYSATGGAWQHGPGPIYDRLAEVLVAHSPVPLARRRTLDVGAGTGAAARAALAAGAAGVVALDEALGMLAHCRAARTAAVAGDALALPFPASAFDAAVAAFSLNHLTDPAGGLQEMARVTHAGGPLVAGSYAADDTHPVKDAVEEVLAARGWQPDPWIAAMRVEAIPLLATPEACAAALASAGLDGAVEQVRVPFPELDARDLVAWRLGMAQHAPFVRRLAPEERRAVAADAVVLLGDAGPLVRSILVLRAVSP